MQGISKACSTSYLTQLRKVRADRLVGKRHGASCVIACAGRTDAGRTEGVCYARVYVVLTPLVGMEMIENLATAAGRQLPEAIALHTVVIVQEQGEEHTTAWDFLPEQPTSPLTAAALLSGGDVKGVLRERKLHYLPRARCRYIGTARVPPGETAAAAREFNEGWDTRLSLLNNDCRAHTTALGVHLTACSPEEVLKPLPPWLGFPGRKTRSVDGGVILMKL